MITTSDSLTRRLQGSLERALDRPSAWSLVVVNLGLVAGVLAFDWSVFEIVFLYWAENVVIGVLNVVRMLIVRTRLVEYEPPPSRTDLTPRQRRLAAFGSTLAGLVLKLFLVPFFIFHYGGFALAHGLFVFVLFHHEDLADLGEVPVQALELLQGPLGWSLALLAASHLVSLWLNFIRNGEYRRVNAAALMMRPYGRVVVLHVAIILGGALVLGLGSPLGLLIVLVVLKTALDLVLHHRERRALAA